MAILDLNDLQVPTLELIFKDANRTALHVTAPTEALINEMKSWVKQGLGQLSGDDAESMTVAYDLMARLLSCNEENVTFTADDLRNKYNVNLWSLIHIVKGYSSFISELENEKN